jgi:hypothetical protein
MGSVVRVVERKTRDRLFHEVDIGGARGPLNALFALKSGGPAAERRGIVDNGRSGVPRRLCTVLVSKGVSKH